MLNTLATYLASLPPGQTVAISAFVPGFLMTLAGFSLRHAMDVSAAKSWGR